jgi:hypothetical protein
VILQKLCSYSTSSIKYVPAIIKATVLLVARPFTRVTLLVIALAEVAISVTPLYGACWACARKSDGARFRWASIAAISHSAAAVAVVAVFRVGAWAYSEVGLACCGSSYRNKDEKDAGAHETMMVGK